MDPFFEEQVEQALTVLRRGGVILYPTDTIWGLGCDATNEAAIDRIFKIKNREDSKSMIILAASQKQVLEYVAAPDLQVFDFLEEQNRPTTVVFENAIGLPDNLIAQDGSIAIRLVKDPFCRHLIKRLQRPLVSTSANISGTPSPQNFQAIAPEIKTLVDHVVGWRQDDAEPALPSQIVKWHQDGTFTFIRK